jgi:hypothetical protein
MEICYYGLDTSSLNCYMWLQINQLNNPSIYFLKQIDVLKKLLR